MLEFAREPEVKGQITSTHAWVIDINNFKHINYEFGYKIGDEVISSLRKRLRGIELQYAMEVIHYSIDKFILLGKYLTLDMCKSLVSILEKPYIVKQNQVNITLSIGMTVIEKDDTFEDIIFRLDRALDESKSSHLKFVSFEGKGNLKFLNYNERLVLLQDAIANDYIVPFFQPIRNNKTGKIEMYEALARIVDKSGNIVMPMDFLDVAKYSKLYPNITKAIITKSFKTFNNRPEIVSINLGNQDICDKETNDFIFNMLKGYRETNVIFEMVEDNLLPYDLVSEFITRVKLNSTKVEFAVDDFGNGFNNFTGIMSLDIDYLKIDGSIIRGVTDNSSKTSHLVLESITRMCKNLGIKTVAEFVSSEQVYNKVVNIGIDYSQGFYISRPLDRLVPVTTE